MFFQKWFLFTSPGFADDTKLFMTSNLQPVCKAYMAPEFWSGVYGPEGEANHKMFVPKTAMGSKPKQRWTQYRRPRKSRLSHA